MEKSKSIEEGNKVTIIDPDSNVHLIKNYRDIANLAVVDGKKFKCKGKHEYRLVNNVWQCERGRKIND